MLYDAKVSRNAEVNSEQTTLKPLKNPAYLNYDPEQEDRPRNSHILSEHSMGRSSALDANLVFEQTQIGSSQKIELDEDLMSQQTWTAQKVEVDGFMDDPMKLIENTNGDIKQIDVVSDLYASELTDIVNIDCLKLDILDLDLDETLNTTNKKVYSKAQIM